MDDKEIKKIQKFTPLYKAKEQEFNQKAKQIFNDKAQSELSRIKDLMKPMNKDEIFQRGDQYHSARKERLKKLEQDRISKAEVEQRNYDDRLLEIAKKYPKVSTLEIGEDEIDEV